MRKSVVSILLISVLGLLVHQSGRSSETQLFDAKKCKQELEIMEGILQTTLGFAVSEPGSPGSEAKAPILGRSGEFSAVNGFYLYGQGAIFTIPASRLRHSHWAGNFELALSGVDLEGLDVQLAAQNELIEQQVQGVLEQVGDQLQSLVAEPAIQAPAPPVGPAPANPPAPPQPPNPSAADQRKKLAEKAPAVKQQEIRKRLAEAQEKFKEKFKKKQEQDEIRRAQFRENLSQVKVFLIEALANHADSLTTVKPNEYINIVIVDDGGERIFLPGIDNARSKRQVLSVQKSTVTDYKTGRLTLEGFKQKIMDYVY